MSRSSSLVKRLSTGEKVYKNLSSGIFSIYKPPDMDLIEISKKIKYKLVNGINELPCRPIEKIVKLDKMNNEPYIGINLADSVEALGPRYVNKDFSIDFLNPLKMHDSGVQSFRIPLQQTGKLGKCTFISKEKPVYEIKGRLGVSTDDFTTHGRLVERATYTHVNSSKMDRLMASIQATYQREMFKHSGIDVQSQEAFDLASKGLLRPKNTKTPPQIYSIRCIEFDRPYFKLEFHSINESTTFIHNLIHDIGIRLKCYAVCVQIRRTKYGFINNEACLAYNELEFKNLYENSTNLTNIAKDFLRKHEKTLLVVQKNFDEINVEDEGGFSILK